MHEVTALIQAEYDETLAELRAVVELFAVAAANKRMNRTHMSYEYTRLHNKLQKLAVALGKKTIPYSTLIYGPISHD